MPLTQERFLLLLIGAGASPFDSSTPTFNQSLVTGAVDDVLTARCDRGIEFYFGTYPIDAQDETSYDESPATEGSFAGGTGYAVSDVNTMSDGSTVTVDAESGGVITEFTVDSSTSTGANDGDTLTQSSTTGGGTGFTMTLDEDNVTTARTLTFDLGATPPLINFIYLGGASFSGTGLAPEDVTIQWDSDDNSGFSSPTAWGSKPFPIRATGGATASLDMTQPNLGLVDAELPAVMAQGRLASYFKSPSFPTGVQERYHRLTISHAATPSVDQRGYLPIVHGGWGWQPDGAQWNPGGLRRRMIQRPNGDTLRGWEFGAQAILEDVYHVKLTEWFAANGNRNRAVFWQDPDLDQRFIQNCALVQVLGIPSAKRPGVFKSATIASAELSESHSINFNLAERFNDETET